MPLENARPPLRRACLLAALASLAAWTASPAMAQEWPAARPVKLIVPFATGGSADVFGRLLAQRLQEALGQSVVVENRPGGGAIIGTDAAAKSPPDGYTLLVMSNTHTVNESLIPNKPYQLMRDFVGVAPINASDLVLVARSGLPQSNPRDLLAAAKARPDGMTYASSGPGTPYHMAGELLKAMAGVKIVHVPYKGSAQARTDVLGGQVDMMFDAIPTMVEQVKGGKVKAIATSGRTRSAIMPDVPTLAERSRLRGEQLVGHTGSGWRGPGCGADTGGSGEEGGRESRDAEKVRFTGGRGCLHEFRRLRQIHSRRDGQMVKSGEGRRHQGGIS